MVGTYSVERGTGAGPTWATVTTVRLRTDDANTADLTNPVVFSASSIGRSYWANVRLAFAGTFTQISNIRHYSDGNINWTYGTGGKLKRGNRDSGADGCPNASYDQASGTPGVIGDNLDTAHSYYSGQSTPSVDINNDTSGSPATIDSTAYVSAGNSHHIVLQVDVAIDATQGVQSTETLTWMVDEI